jgi:hypothetical protein
MKQVRQSPGLALLTLAGGLAVGVLIGALFEHGGSAARAANHTGASSAIGLSQGGSAAVGVGGATVGTTSGRSGEGYARVSVRNGLRMALDRGVEQADSLGGGGEAAAAVWVGGDSAPVLSGPTMVLHRMWSMSKAVVTIATLEAMQNHPDPVLRDAVSDAIRRSDNCAIRRVIVALQDHSDQGIDGAVEAFQRVLAAAGAGIGRRPQQAPPETACVHYLDAHQEGLPSSDLGEAAEFGTAEWTEDDAISFAHALSEGVYADAGAYLLKLMGLPKEPPLEEPPPPSAPPLDWGAGAAFPAAWKPAWKAGWGGSQDDPPHFLAGQIVVLHIGGVPVAAAAIFVPKHEPPNDNPGITEAPEALETMFAAARDGLESERIGDTR